MENQTYFDAAYNYRWFFKSRRNLGSGVQGFEVSCFARQIGVHFYNRRKYQLTAAEITRLFLQLIKIVFRPTKKATAEHFSLA